MTKGAWRHFVAFIVNSHFTVRHASDGLLLVLITILVFLLQLPDKDGLHLRRTQ